MMSGTLNRHGWPVVMFTLTVLFAVWMWLDLGGTVATRILSDFGLALVALAAARRLFTAARHHRGGSAKGWRSLGVAALLWGGGQTVWAAQQNLFGMSLPIGSLPDVGYLLAVLFLDGRNGVADTTSSVDVAASDRCRCVDRGGRGPARVLAADP